MAAKYQYFVENLMQVVPIINIWMVLNKNFEQNTLFSISKYIPASFNTIHICKYDF